jgi:putative endonuclease
MKIFTSRNQQIGEVGEIEAVKYLINKGLRIIERNHTRKWGEIDIVAVKGSVLHFIEVKAITVRDKFSREIFYRPEDHMSPNKLKRLRRVIQTYLIEKVTDENREWQFDLVCVYLINEHLEKIETLEDIIL